MNSNCLTNCYCANLCNCHNIDTDNDIQTSTCCPPTCCSCPYCRPRSKLKLSKMSSKPKANNGAAVASRNASKPKPKTIRPKKVTRNDKERGQESGLSQYGLPMKADKPMNSHHSLHSNSSSLKAMASPRLEKTQSKQQLSLNISLLKAQEERYAVLNGCPKGYHLNHPNGSNQRGREPASHNIFPQPRNSYSKPLKTKASTNAQSWQDQLSRMCNCCSKTSPTYSYASSPNASRHSFPATKSGSQLDVIDEVDSDAENNRRQCSSADGYAALDGFCAANTEPEKVQRRSSSSSNQDAPAPQLNKTKMLKSLEDSCADFLNIVCDNIMESVQKSVDCKLKEFTVHATAKFTGLAQKLDENEAAVKNFLQDQTEKLTEQNKRDFEVFYLRLQDLFGNPTEAKINKARDSESQFKAPEEEIEGLSNASEQESNNGHDTCDSKGNIVKCSCCDCCIEEDYICHPCPTDEVASETTINTSNEARETGGCLSGRETQAVDEKVAVKLWDSCAPQTSCPPKASTNSCLATSGKINCFCSSTGHSHGWVGNDLNARATKTLNRICSKQPDLKLKSVMVSDNYDTSGYATEPEDNSEATVVSSGRKRLQKKSPKQHSLKRQSSAANNFGFHNEDRDGLHDVCERSSTLANKRQSRSSLRSCGSSPTRLSRL